MKQELSKRVSRLGCGGNYTSLPRQAAIYNREVPVCAGMVLAHPGIFRLDFAPSYRRDRGGVAVA